MLKRITASILALIVLGSLAACGSANSAPAAPAAAPAPAAAAPEPVAAPAAPAPAAAPAVEVDPADYLKGKTIRVVIGSTSVTGDTYVTADLVTRHISAKYDCNIKVDPIGAGRALEEIVSTQPDGDTIMMFHDMTYLGVLFGAYEAADYGLDKMVVGGSFGYSPSDSFAATIAAPYNSIAEMAQWMKDNPTETVRIAVEAGGVSQLGFNSIYDWVRTTYGEDVSSRIKAFVTGSTQEKLQALWDGNCQVIYAAATSLEEYLPEEVEAQLRLKVVGLMSAQQYKDYDWPTFADQGITLNGEPYDFGKEYFVFYPVGIQAEYVAAWDAAMEAVCTSDKYIDDIHNLGYEPQFIGSDECTAHIYAKRDTFAGLIANSPNFDDVVG
jgi:tripartite-type tricarboxylate transporter receptor subunit TctC